MKKILKYLAVAILTGLFYSIVLWVFYLIKATAEIDLKETALRGIVFGLIYTPAYYLATKNRKERNDKK